MGTRPRTLPGKLKAWLGRSVVLENEVSWLLFFSFLDILMTWILLSRSPRVVESNPIAAWFFVRFNMVGMIVYKFGIIGVVILIAEGVEQLRPGRGRFVLRLGIAAAAAVVVYSATLLYRFNIGLIE